eukprot:281351-Rhodomonas_salina.1
MHTTRVRSGEPAGQRASTQESVGVARRLQGQGDAHRAKRLRRGRLGWGRVAGTLRLGAGGQQRRGLHADSDASGAARRGELPCRPAPRPRSRGSLAASLALVPGLTAGLLPTLARAPPTKALCGVEWCRQQCCWVGWRLRQQSAASASSGALPGQRTQHPRTLARFPHGTSHLGGVGPRSRRMPTGKAEALKRAETRLSSARLLATKAVCCVIIMSGKPRVLCSVLAVKNASPCMTKVARTGASRMSSSAALLVPRLCQAKAVVGGQGEIRLQHFWGSVQAAAHR